MRVKAESDEKHYGSRGYPAGPMHPVTERLIAAVRTATDDAEIGPSF